MPDGSCVYKCAFCRRQIRCVPGMLSRPAPPMASEGYVCIREMPSFATMPVSLKQEPKWRVL